MGSGCCRSSFQHSSIQSKLFTAKLGYQSIHLDPNYSEYQNSFIRQQIKSKQATGLSRLSAPSQTGSLLQCLSACLPLVDYLLSQIQDFIPTSLTKAFTILISTQWTKYFQIIVPRFFLQLLGQELPEFQNPSDELDSLFKLMGENFKRNQIPISVAILNVEQEEKQAAESWQQNLMENCSIFTDLFTGQIKVSLLCARCFHNWQSYKVFQQLKLKVPEVPNPTLEECFQVFDSEERQESQWCPRCNRNQKVYFSQKLWKLPTILVISLEGNQDERNIRCPTEDFDLNRFIKKQKYQPKYYLFGKIDYRSQEGYVSKIKINHSWFLHQESTVSELESENVMSGQTHILFFYQISAQKILKQSPSLVQNWPHVTNPIDVLDIDFEPIVRRLTKDQRKFLKRYTIEEQSLEPPSNYFETRIRSSKKRIIELNK